MKWKIFVFVTFFILLGIGFLSLQKITKPQESQITPTTLPSPTIQTKNPNWKIFNDNAQKITFEYPHDLLTKYIHSQKWPPKITVSLDKFSCSQNGQTSGQPEMTVQKTIGEITYCIQSSSEGAAGTIHTIYTYTFQDGNKLVKLDFTLGYPQCGNYENPQKAECEKERQTFDLDNLINQIAKSITFGK